MSPGDKTIGKRSRYIQALCVVDYPGVKVLELASLRLNIAEGGGREGSLEFSIRTHRLEPSAQMPWELSRCQAGKIFLDKTDMFLCTRDA